MCLWRSQVVVDEITTRADAEDAEEDANDAELAEEASVVSKDISNSHRS